MRTNFPPTFLQIDAIPSRHSLCCFRFLRPGAVRGRKYTALPGDRVRDGIMRGSVAPIHAWQRGATERQSCRSHPTCPRASALAWMPHLPPGAVGADRFKSRTPDPTPRQPYRAALPRRGSGCPPSIEMVKPASSDRSAAPSGLNRMAPSRGHASLRAHLPNCSHLTAAVRGCGGRSPLLTSSRNQNPAGLAGRYAALPRNDREGNHLRVLCPIGSEG